jgi:Zn-dependent peptidase ImmA (M78 family)
MKLVRDTTGRFRQRPHYESSELDRECENVVSTFLRKRYGEVRYPLSTEDLATLIEHEAGDLDQYADLSEFGPGVEGVTIFHPGAKPDVKISDQLASDSARENRLRTTMAHEFGHVHFHAYLFDSRYSDTDLFKNQSRSLPIDNKQVCKRDTLIEASASDWMEWQAGHVCGAILMPARAVAAFVRERFAAYVDGKAVTVESSEGTVLMNAIREEFKTSHDAARVRLLRLKIVTQDPHSTRLV